MAITRPSTVHYPFAEAALPVNINTVPDTPTGSALASWQQGFPPITMTPLGSGGLPPYGADFNGVLNTLSANVQWWNAGGAPAYDSALSTAIGGYPVGAVLVLADGFSYVVSTVAANTTNPNSSMTGWAPFAGLMAGAEFYIQDSGPGASSILLMVAPAVTAYFNGLRVSFKAKYTNTSASVIIAMNALSTVTLVRSDGAALSSGDIIAGNIYEAVYDSATSKFWLLTKVPSQNPAAATLFASVHNVTGSRVLGTSAISNPYTNSTGVPMLVSLIITGAGSGGNLILDINSVDVARNSWSQVGAVRGTSIIVPAGATYSAWSTDGSTLNTWVEIY
ncbi:MAG TPA: hypothetical protein VM537_17520 [Anaerolineae bacterium]|nr:hypothetical protein [Anaerolineae bacterium]